MSFNRKKFIKSIARLFGLGIVRYEALESLIKDSNELDRIKFAPLELELIKSFSYEFATEILECWSESKAQLRQDLFVLNELQFKREGFFVEFGATNGIDLSNTFLLEKKFNWRGILAEPARCWHEELMKNRSCIINTDCVWHESGRTIQFIEASEGELSTIHGYEGNDLHSSKRNESMVYDVSTISLIELLHKYDCPKKIDYLSIDTEGSEFDILRTFPFDEFTFSVITVEHNYSSTREPIQKLLKLNGYVHVNQEISMFDDWFVHESSIAQARN